jgi:protein-disulfide isomerase
LDERVTNASGRVGKVADILVVLVATASLVLLVAREMRPRAAAGGSGLPVTRFEKWDELLSAGNRIGAAAAPVQVVVFSDYQCPTCRIYHRVLTELQARNSDSIATTVVHFPLRQHKFAVKAANAAVCAAQQNRFAEANAILYSHEEALGPDTLTAVAVAAGVPDIAVFSRCVASADTLEMVRRGIALATTMNVPGTPTLVINGMRFETLVDEPTLIAYVTRLLAVRSGK